jgi:hypothetical protein
VVPRRLSIAEAAREWQQDRRGGRLIRGESRRRRSMAAMVLELRIADNGKDFGSANPPCRQPGRKLADAHGRKDLEMAFVKQAAGLRGLVGLVEREGEVRAGDAIRIIAPRG